MPTVREIRARRLAERLEGLRAAMPSLLNAPGQEVWLFGSLARGDWDAFSDVDLIAVAPTQHQADELGERILGACLADDVLCFDAQGWRRRRQGQDPLWRAIGRDALRLAGGP
jgi:predicted nucleotidyltransferase